ncbi:MAG: NADH-quinone oxidoreductase subunit D [Micrococcales bacterium]|nr:NADH-quinone oxidoreductase subunit D [Micrococcales bacterium]
MPAQSTSPAGEMLLAGVGPGSRLDCDLPLDLPPDHPLSHGVLRLRLRVVEGVVTGVDPDVGWVHRSAEKLFEARDYRQLIMLADRHDWLGAMSGELSVVLAVEEMLRLEPPARVVWLRTALAELTRVASHLAFLAAYPYAAAGPADEAREGARGAREELLTLLEDYTGGRMHVMVTRVGGLHLDMPAGWPARVGAGLVRARAALDLVAAALAAQEGLRGLAVLSPADAAAHGASGVVARASGLDLDVRRDEPYGCYGELFAPGGPGRVPLRAEGDALARLDLIVEQARVATDLVEECLARVPGGPVSIRLPKVLRVPEGETYRASETPLGRAGVWLVSTGDRAPWRLKLRTPSFAHASALGAVLTGSPVDDLGRALASVPLVSGDVDR